MKSNNFAHAARTLVVAFVVFFALSSPCDAQDAPPETVPLTFDSTPGSYAIYRDTTYGSPVYIGLLSLGGNKIAIRLYEPATKNVLLVFQTFYRLKNDVDPGSIDPIYGSFTSSEPAGKVLGVVCDWMNSWLHSRNQFAEKPNYEFRENIGYKFSYWIPVLQMESAGGAQLVTAGVAESGNDPSFFAYSGEPIPKVGSKYTIAASERTKVSLGGIEVSLDGNWTGGSDGVWRLAKASDEDAFCSVETIDMSSFGAKERFDMFDLIKLYILHPFPAGVLLSGDLRIFVQGEHPCLFYRSYDPVTKLVTVNYRMFVSRDETALSVVSFGVLESLYDGNKDYFEALLGIKF